MEGRLAQTALTLPIFPFTGKQPFSQKPAAIADDVILHKILLISDQRSIDQVRVIQKVDVHPGRAVIEQVAILGGPAAEHTERVASRQRHVADEQVRLWPGSREDILSSLSLPLTASHKL